MKFTEIGAPLTSVGQLGVDSYISEIKIKSEAQKQMTVAELSPKSLYEKIMELENTKTVDDRDLNNILAFKFKEIIDSIDKFGIIKHIKNALYPPPPQIISDLTTNSNTKINLDHLIESVAMDNINLGNALMKLKI